MEGSTSLLGGNGDEEQEPEEKGTPPAPEPAPARRPRTRRPRSVGAPDVIGAIRLALEGADNEKTAIAVIRKLVDYAPPTANSAEPVQLFIKAIREAGGRIFVP